MGDGIILSISLIVGICRGVGDRGSNVYLTRPHRGLVPGEGEAVRKDVHCRWIRRKGAKARA